MTLMLKLLSIYVCFLVFSINNIECDAIPSTESKGECLVFHLSSFIPRYFYLLVAKLFLPSFQILLRNQKGEELILNYKLENHSIAQKFARHIKHIILSSKYENAYTAWAVYPEGEEARKLLYNSLRDNMLFFEENNNIGLNFVNKLPPCESLTTEDLNLIHSDFERLITSTFEVPTGSHNVGKNVLVLNASTEISQKLEDALNAVNGRVHSLEHVLKRGDLSSNSFFTTYLRSQSNIKGIPIKAEEYKLFRLGNVWGGLYLGYGTTGKSLYHIYKDRDLALVDAGGRPSPQQVVTSNILAAFYDTDSHEVIYSNMMNWLEKNKVCEKLGLNPNDPSNAHGYVKLGQLVIPPQWQNLTRNEIIAIISPYDEIVRYFINFD